MFQTLTTNLIKIFDNIKGRGILTSSHIDSAMQDIRIALIEADVALPVVEAFISGVSSKAKGLEVVKSVSPAQMVIKIINDEMIHLLQPDDNESKINLLQCTESVNIMVVGLQGSGKTTSSAKLALQLKQQGKKVLLVSLDTYRPAAQSQLEILAKSIEVDSLPIIKEELPISITKRAITTTKTGSYDVVIYDTAGRLHINKKMINEAIEVKALVKPIETFLVMDAMIGQDALNVASSFNKELNITSIILSRIDGDSKAGAALSTRYITGKPIKFLSTGEKLDAFEEFNAKRMVSRILGKGDIVSFVEKATSLMGHDEAEKTANKLKKGKFNLNDYIAHIKIIKKMGGISSMINFLPGMNKLLDKKGGAAFGDEVLVTQVAIVHSMTIKERKNPDILNASRKKRVAAGSGSTVQEVNKLLKQFKQINIVMKKSSRMDPKSLIDSGVRKLFS